MTAELVKSRNMEEVLKLQDNNISNTLDRLPENKIHCSIMGANTIKNLINNYYKNNIEKETQL